MNKYYAILSLFLVGCGSNIVFEPNDLPDGHIGKEYYVPVTVSGGTGPVVDLTYEVQPLNSGVKIIFAKKKYYTKYIYNNFIIQGIPQSTGLITIDIRGGVIASAGESFEKKYKINVLK